MLERGELFGIYPEGTRSRDGMLHKGHTGAGPAGAAHRCADRPGRHLRARARSSRPTRKFPKPFKVVPIRFGRPIDVDRYRDRADDRLVLRQIIDEVMFEIRELSGQEYVDAYATKKAESAARPRRRATCPAVNGDDDGTTAPVRARRSSADVPESGRERCRPLT